MRSPLIMLIVIPLLTSACSKRRAEDPFSYPFVHQLQIRPQPDDPYSGYKAFYLLTEDFEPLIESTADVDQMREAIAFASKLSSTNGIPWTHFVDANTLAPAYVSDDGQIKQRCQAMVGDLKQLVKGGDDCELHLHGPLDARLLDLLRSQNKLHIRASGLEAAQDYRQRRSFFFQSFYYGGYRGMVASLSYGKLFLEQAIYDGHEQVLAFRPGGWDHGASSQDTRLYFSGLSDAGLVANSGLSLGNFGTPDFGVGNSPGRNVATVKVEDRSIVEVSPTWGPGGYVNPVISRHLDRLAAGATDGMPVIVSVYHLGALQQSRFEEGAVRLEESERFAADLQKSHEALERHFQEVAELRSKKVLYPITLRELLSIISEH